jgi:hypothetical protein
MLKMAFVKKEINKWRYSFFIGGNPQFDGKCLMENGRCES